MTNAEKLKILTDQKCDKCARWGDLGANVSGCTCRRDPKPGVVDGQAYCRFYTEQENTR